jgi:hypothetical protein
LTNAELAVLLARLRFATLHRDDALVTLALAPHHLPHKKEQWLLSLLPPPPSRCVSETPGGRAASRRSRRAAAGSDWRNRAPKHARKKALSAPIAPGNARVRPRATPRLGNEHRRSTRADLLSRSRVHRLSSAARPPASSAARPSRCVIIATAFLPTIYPTRATRVPDRARARVLDADRPPRPPPNAGRRRQHHHRGCGEGRHQRFRPHRYVSLAPSTGMLDNSCRCGPRHNISAQVAKPLAKRSVCPRKRALREAFFFSSSSLALRRECLRTELLL